MRYFIKVVSIIGLLSILQLANSDSIVDSYNTGDTLTATTLNNIKSAVNDNDTRIDALEAALAAHTSDLANPHAVTKTQVGLSNLEDILVNFTATTPPAVNDDINSGYSVGSVWIDVAQKEAYVLLDSTPGLAVWKLTANKFYAVGDTGPAGGIVFYVTSDGLHGLEAAPVDQGSAEWGCPATEIQGASGWGIGWGDNNTADILNGCPGVNAAKLADTYILNRYQDWYLPARDELHLLTNSSALAGGFPSGEYWSSSEDGSGFAWYRDFTLLNITSDAKGAVYAVRAIRAF